MLILTSRVQQGFRTGDIPSAAPYYQHWPWQLRLKSLLTYRDAHPEQDPQARSPPSPPTFSQRLLDTRGYFMRVVMDRCSAGPCGTFGRSRRIRLSSSDSYCRHSTIEMIAFMVDNKEQL